ncbi:transposase [Sinomicrobium pectinilyticum]|uniref:transposase n=1 Tax=Sinomicrobium pectinilyticum TaxID=1084421 RepID=UPI003742CC5F
MLLYHFVCPIKYRPDVLDNHLAKTFLSVCLGIEECYEIHFLETGLDGDHVHFLIQDVLTISPD